MKSSVSPLCVKNTYNGIPYLHNDKRSSSLFSQIKYFADRIWASSLYVPVLMLIAAFFLVLPAPKFGCVVMAAVISFMLVFCRDILSAMLPTLLFCLLTTGFYEDYGFLIRNWPLFIDVIIALILHFILYPAAIKRGKMTFPLLAVSIATVLGGIGTISVQEYFAPVSLYYVIGLGPALFLIYTLLYSQLQTKRNYDTLERLLSTVYYAGIFAGIIVIYTYLSRFDEFLSLHTGIYISYRNFCTTIMLTALPCTCLKTSKGTYRFGGLWFMYLCLLFSASRSGLVFGSALLLGCLILMYLQSDCRIQKRVKRILPFAIPVAVAVIVFLAIKLFSSRLIDGTLLYLCSRYDFWSSGVKDFLSSPIFGIGLGNMSHQHIFIGVGGSIVWYHNCIIQIFGSMGIIGFLAFGWMYFTRIKLLLTRRTAKTPIVLMSVLGMFLVSLTNPGEFCPMPNAFLMVSLFTVLELLPARANAQKSLITICKLNTKDAA